MEGYGFDEQFIYFNFCPVTDFPLCLSDILHGSKKLSEYT